MKREDFLQGEAAWSAEKELEYIEQKKTIAEQQAEIERLESQLAWFKKVIYGQKSEKTEYVTPADGSEQLSLFDESEKEESRKEREAEQPIVVAEHTRKPRRTHDEMAKDLPVEEVIHEIEDLHCDECDSDMEIVGKEFVRDELVRVPERFFIRKHYVEVAKCSRCGNDPSEDAQLPDIAKTVFKKAEAPSPMIPRSFCSPELLAWVAYEKYCNGMPLYRIEQDLKRKDICLSRATLANWIIYSAKNILRPLRDLMRTELLSQPVIHADETEVQVLREPGRSAKTKSYMWVYCAGKIGSPSNVLFEYQPTRKASAPKAFLEGFTGALVCDGYDAYNSIKDTATRCGCWAHLRRKFVEALPSDKKALADSYAAVGLDYCNRLFEIERECADMSADERAALRESKSWPLCDEFFGWLDSFVAAGKTNLSQAVNYARSERKYLTAFFDDPSIPISNNRAENAIRPFVIGRKQWLFSDSVKGAEASAIYYSIAATACANALKVEAYFTHILSELAKMDGNDDISHLLPWSDEMLGKFGV